MLRARKNTEKMRSRRACITQTSIAHNQISSGQLRLSLVFPARDTLRVLMDFSCSHSSRGTKLISDQILVCWIVSILQTTLPRSVAESKEASKENCSQGSPGPTHTLPANMRYRSPPRSAPVTQAEYVTVCKLLHFRCFIL